MAAPHRELRVRLQRDALTTPWGFRLQGGKDFKAPLTVQRVFVGSPADGELHRGDVISTIENTDTNGLVHKQAQDLIKSAGGQLMLSVKRGQPIRSGYSAPQPAAQPAKQSFKPKPGPTMYGGGGHSFGTDFNRPYSQPVAAPVQRAQPAPTGSMLGRVNETLNQSIWQGPGQPEYDQQGDPEYEHRPVGQIKAIFTGGQQRADPIHRTPGKAWIKAAPDSSGLSDPGWTPGMKPKQTTQEQHSPDTVPTTYEPEVHHERPAGQTGGRPGRAWKKPEPTIGALAEPGWTPGQSRGGGWSPVKGPSHLPLHHRQPSAPAPPPVPINREPERPRHIEYDGRPAWAGSLKSAQGPKTWEVHAAAEAAGIAPEPRAQAAQSHAPGTQQQAPANVQPHKPRVQNVHYAPGDSAPTYEQHDPSSAGPEHEGANVVHAQYNSPLGLYSKANVQDALEGQTGGGPGAGTLHVSGGGQSEPPKDFAQSDVARMIAEEEGRNRKPRGHGLRPHDAEQSARHQEQTAGEEMNYQGYQDHSRQSQSFKALETNMTMQGEDMGASDF